MQEKFIELGDFLDYEIRGREKSKTMPRFGAWMVECMVWFTGIGTTKGAECYVRRMTMVKHMWVYDDYKIPSGNIQEVDGV